MRFAMPRSPHKFVKLAIGLALVVATVLGFGIEALSQSGSSSPAYASGEVTPAAVQTRAVTVLADGKSRTATAVPQATVSQLLTRLGIGLRATDRVTPSTSTTLTHVSSVVVTRVKYAKVAHRKRIPRKTKKRHVARLVKGQHKVLRRGHPGLRRDTIRLTYVNGKLAGRTTVARKVLRHPLARVIGIGTGTGRNASPAQAKAIAKTMLAARGWNNQFSCLEQMWTRESGWNLHAHNSAGAYGIPQALPGAKMASAGSDWANNARTQIAWGLSYIAGRYGTPCHAWAVWQTQSWY